MDFLGRYYTQELFSNLLIDQFNSRAPSTVLDLGAGGGSLIKAASQRWQNADFYAADIDKNSIKKINKELPFVKIINADSLNKNIAKKLELKVDSVDIAVCNPPYLKLEDKRNYFSLFEEADLENCKNLKKVTSDIIFLAQNLRMLKKDGELGIILPDSLLTGHDFKILRESILSKHSIRGIIELPENIFSKTEARTHILLIEKGCSAEIKTQLYISNKEGQCYDQIEVSTNSLGKRMDFTFHKWNQKREKTKSFKTLTELGCEIKRGIQTHAELKVQNKAFVHTTNLNTGTAVSFLKPVKYKNKKLVFAEVGDIILARVGRGCIGKVSMVKRGRGLLSDCVYRIRVPKLYRHIVLDALTNKTGQAWLKANSHGVCAKVISKADLLQFPIQL